jgi:DNA repair protein RecO (recombination protein O)
MSAEKSAAIVLRVIEFSETSCVVTLMTREFGKITGLAKGARRKKSPFEAALDVLSIVRIVFLRKTPPAMDLLTESKLERRFRAASSNLERLYAAYYVAELLTVMTETADPQPSLFDIAETTIMGLDDGLVDPFWLLTRFELRLLEVLGHLPVLNACVSCQRVVPPNATKIHFGFLDGGVLCTNCRMGKQSVMAMNRESLSVLQLLSADHFESLPTLPRSAIQAEVRQLLNQNINHLLGFRPRVQPYLKQFTKTS